MLIGCAGLALIEVWGVSAVLDRLVQGGLMHPTDRDTREYVRGWRPKGAQAMP